MSSSDGTDLAACRAVAYRAAKRDSSSLRAVLAVAEDMLLDEANYEVVVALLEDMQNLVSHGLAVFATPEQVAALLGPRSAVCWRTLTSFWAEVAAWCVQADLPRESSDKILSVENEQLRTLLWTSNRTQSTGEKLGLVHAVQFEQAGQPPIPGFSHIAVALSTFGD